MIKISVRSLVEFILKEGDLESVSLSKSRAHIGQRIHQQIQEGYTAFEKEVHLKHTFNQKNISLEVSGRADGINKEDHIIDEIKSTHTALKYLTEDYNPLHWAQAKFYGYIYLLENDLTNVTVQLRYVQIETSEEKIFKKTFTFDALELFVQQVVSHYIDFILLKKKTLDKRNYSINALDFPFDNYRPYQRDIAVLTYQCIRDQKNAFIQAPTGIGKTIATLFPAIKGLQTLHYDKIFYLTAKTIARTVAEDSIQLLIENDLAINAITLTAKDKICFCETATCQIEECIYMKDYYTKLGIIIKETLIRQQLLTRQVVEAIAQKYQVCPFELSLDLSLFMDIIICDYNYVFDPRVRLKRYFEENNHEIVLLIDESHNMIGRAREMYSSELIKENFLSARRLIKDSHPKLAKKLYKVNKVFLEEKKQLETADFYITEDAPEDFYTTLSELTYYLDDWLEDYKEHEHFDEILDLYFEVLAYLRIADLDFSGSLFYFQKIEKNNYRAKLFNIDPSVHLKAIERRSSIFFSATLSPINYYNQLLGGEKDDPMYKFPSPFDQKNRQILFSNELSTRYKHRKENISLIAKYIKTFTTHNPGNNIVFFPSYKFLHQTVEEYIECYGEENIIIQERQMPEDHRENFLDQFKSEKNITAFVVLGGIFSEGIDLTADQLIGTILVGIGLPYFNLENNLIREFFDERNNAGFEYAYAYPAIIKIMQAAGRVIRTTTDRGNILLLGDRFSSSYYRRMLPKDWGNKKVTLKQLPNVLDRFWQKK